MSIITNSNNYYNYSVTNWISFNPNHIYRISLSELLCKAEATIFYPNEHSAAMLEVWGSGWRLSKGFSASPLPVGSLELRCFHNHISIISGVVYRQISTRDILQIKESKNLLTSKLPPVCELLMLYTDLITVATITMVYKKKLLRKCSARTHYWQTARESCASESEPG